MEKVLACRLCLTTDVKLLDMFKNSLNTAYESLTGIEIKPGDRMQCVCNMCSVLLLKNFSFQKMCRNSEDLIKFAESQHHIISTDYIRSLHLTSPYSNLKIQKDNNIIDYIYVEKQELKEEDENWDWGTNYIFKDSDLSDDETLAQKIISKKNNDIKKRENDDDVKLEDDFNDIPLKDEDDGDNNDDDGDDFKDGEVVVFILTKEQQIEEVQSRKKSLNYLNSFYKCDQCFKGFMTDVTYKNHMVRHDPSSGPHVCVVCGSRWARAHALRSHRATAHERRYLCRLCNYVSKSRHRAKEHSMWHSGHTFVCKFCGASFTKSTSHLTHIRLHHPSKHSCELCGESFIGEMGLKMHKKKAHRVLKKVGAISELCCDQCSVQFQTTEALQRHSNDDTPCDANKRPCVKCGEGFSNEEELREHLKVHSKEEPVKCEECNRTFSRGRSYAQHYQRAHAPAPARASPARAHVVCEVCGKKCNSITTFRNHQRIHTGERPFQCNQCPKRFSVFQRLQLHHRTHTGERPYQCHHCPKAFKNKAALNRHDRVHTGAKPYECSHCGKAFSQSNSLKGHIRTVHLKMPSPYRPRRQPAE